MHESAIGPGISLPTRTRKKEVLTDFANNIKNMEWLMADAVESIYDLEDE